MTAIAPQPLDLPPLNEAELAELDRFLASEATADEVMMLDAVNGYLTALVLSPAEPDDADWMAPIWHPSATQTPHFQSPEQQSRIQALIRRQRNDILRTLDDNPDNLSPVFDTVSYGNQAREYLDGEMWAYGFLQGVARHREAWRPVFEHPDAMDLLLPIYALGSNDLRPEHRALVATPEKREELTRHIPLSVAALWRRRHPDHRPKSPRAPTTLERALPKVGRNDPCPCGSGKKWKKCCGIE